MLKGCDFAMPTPLLPSPKQNKTSSLRLKVSYHMSLRGRVTLSVSPTRVLALTSLSLTSPSTQTNSPTHTGTMSQSLNEKQKLLQEARYLRTRVSVFINWKWVFFLSLVVLSFPLGCARFLFTV